MKLKVLLIYPNLYRITGLPAGLASLCAVLKENGHDTKIFDTAFYRDKDDEDQTIIRAERGMSKLVEDAEKYLPDNDSDMEEDIIEFICGYKPDLIGISILEIVYELSTRLTRIIKRNFKNIPIVAGGVFPSIAPEIITNENSIDIICMGEGETALLELCNRISEKESFIDVKGLLVKSKGQIYKNPPSHLHDLNALPHPDYSEFDKRLFYKPMQGKMYKMVNIVTSRGCCYNCTFCAAPRLRKLFNENNCGRYNRLLSIERVIDQIYFQVKMHNPNFVYFSSENFLSMPEKEFKIFVNEYAKINIPFWFQTRIETITYDRLSKLKNLGMHWLSTGLEHGNEKFRKSILKRNYSNKMFIEKMEVLKRLNIGASINNMIGLPFESRELIFDTIMLNRKLWLSNPKLESNSFVFTPFIGCELYYLCKENGLLDNMKFTNSTDLSEQSVLDFSDEFQKDLKGLIRTFNLYIKLPEKYYQQIKIAEQSDEEGDMMLKKLSNMVKSEVFL